MLNKESMAAMFSGLTEITRDIILKDLREPFSAAIAGILTCPTITPAPQNILNAMKDCPLENTIICIIGQDPYPSAGVANGHAFGTAPGEKVPPSLNNIVKCMKHCGLLDSEPESGDLSAWAKQGVLLLNSALTTEVGKSNEHASHWAPFTDALIEIIAAKYKPIFILLGEFAKKKRKFISGCTYFEYGHPSPINAANKQKNNPKNFINCKAFIEANQELVAQGKVPIDWGIIGIPARPYETINVHTKLLPRTDIVYPAAKAIFDSKILFVFTDGGARANGKPECVASWAYHITDSKICAEAYGIVPPIDIKDKLYKSSNNRGELMAIGMAVQLLLKSGGNFEHESVEIVTDSNYSIIRCDQVCKDESIPNYDLIKPITDDLNTLRTYVQVRFRHIRSHKMRPGGEFAGFLWQGNDFADKLCQVPL